MQIPDFFSKFGETALALVDGPRAVVGRGNGTARTRAKDAKYIVGQFYEPGVFEETMLEPGK